MRYLKVILSILMISFGITSVYFIKTVHNRYSDELEAFKYFEAEMSSFESLLSDHCSEIMNLEQLNQKNSAGKLPIKSDRIMNILSNFFSESRYRILGNYPSYVFATIDLHVKQQAILAHDVAVKNVYLFFKKNSQGSFIDCYGKIFP